MIVAAGVLEGSVVKVRGYCFRNISIYMIGMRDK